MNKVNEFEHMVDESYMTANNANYTTFSIESNLHYKYSSAEQLLEHPEIIADMIMNHYQQQVPRLAILDSYYKARNTNIFKNRRKEKEKADHRAAHNFAKVICQFDVGYNTGNAIKVEAEAEELKNILNEFHLNNDINELNSELWLDIDKYGRAYTIQVRNKNDEDKIFLSNVFETFIVYDTSVERNPIAAVRYPRTKYTNNADKTCIKPVVYTDKIIREYTETSLNAIKLKSPKDISHEFKEVPVIEYSSNRFRQGIYEDVLTLIDLYDAAQSDTANYMTDLNDALLVISGDIGAAGLTTEEAIKQKEANMLLLESGIDVNGNKTSVTAGYIYKQYDVNGVEAYKKRVQSDIHKISNIPDLSDENFSGNQSGEAMKYKLFGFEQMTDVKQRLFTKCMMQRYRLLFNLKSSISEITNINLRDIKITFNPNMPKAVLEELKALYDAGAEFSQKTLLSQASFVDNAEKEIERVQEEDEQRKEDGLFDFEKSDNNQENHAEKQDEIKEK
ncbi:phage portal protein [Melissococcus plutonius]|uniref:phage portal protein n=1 Tax=Melissococcus plutonius TaxID=33970 RepID=UPI0021E56FBF|nr:phage portal protein [Melissococcus plutonius]MCV2505947.1 phage portal protein [Melissococcus plutonius]MCV2528035.1 phage portal protein [Melissococcus plutonius]